MTELADLPPQRRVARNALMRGAGEAIAKLASLAFFVTMARELGRQGFGSFMFALSLTGALTLAAGFGTDDLLAREVARDRRRGPRMLADASSVKALGAVVMLAVAAIAVNVGDFSADARLAVYIVGIGAAVEVLAKSWYSIFQAHERLELMSASLILQRVATAAAGVLVLKLGGGLVAASLVYTAGAFLALGSAELGFRRALRLRRARRDRSQWWPLLRAGVPIGLAGLLLTLLLRIDVTMLSFLTNAAETGTYAAAFRLVEATQFLSWSFAAAMMPWLARAEAGGPRGVARGYSLALKTMNALLLPVGLAFILFAAPIIHLLYGPQFHASVAPLRLLGIMSVLYGINSFAATTLIARYRPTDFARAVAPIIVQNIACNLVLIPIYGARGAAFDAMLSSLLLAGLSLRQARRGVGEVRFVHAFAGPLTAGAAACAVVLLLHAPVLVEAGLGIAVYAATLAIFEWTVFRDDARVYLRVLPTRLSGAAASIFQADRTRA